MAVLYYDNSPVLKHYGVKGMKWGVRRTPEQLRYNKSSVIAAVNRKALHAITSSGIVISKMSAHAGDQAEARKISAKEIVDSITSPLYTKPIKYDSRGRPSQQFVGKYSTVAINPLSGTITSIWPTGQKTKEKYLRLQKEGEL